GPQIDVTRSARLLTRLVGRLTDEEQGRFWGELQAAARTGDEGEVEQVITTWLVSVAVREHPDFARQEKEFRNLVESGELYDGLDKASSVSAWAGLPDK